MAASAPRLDDMIALNQELAALIRAGIPLELGLKQHTATWPSRFAALAERVSRRLSSGQSLVDALREEGPAVSPAYAAVVQAGLESGRLPEALEQLADLGLIVQNLRRRVWLAAIYPLMVCSLAYLLFVGFVIVCVPTWLQTRDAMMLPHRWLFDLLAELNATVRYWGFAVPLAAGILFLVQQLRQSSGGAWGQIRSSLWMPGVGHMYRYLLRAQFARLCAVLIEHEVPAGRAVTLAAESTGDERLKLAAEDISQSLERGATWSQAIDSADRLPEFLRWMLIAGEKQRALPAVLRQVAETYGRQADGWQWWLQQAVPVLLVIFVSGGVVLLYCLGLFLPLQMFWNDLMSINP
ncbi:MAG: type II secretion system F family protein [Planctomycetaceae bacterium]